MFSSSVFYLLWLATCECMLLASHCLVHFSLCLDLSSLYVIVIVCFLMCLFYWHCLKQLYPSSHYLVPGSRGQQSIAGKPRLLSLLPLSSVLPRPAERQSLCHVLGLTQGLLIKHAQETSPGTRLGGRQNSWLLSMWRTSNSFRPLVSNILSFWSWPTAHDIRWEWDHRLTG